MYINSLRRAAAIVQAARDRRGSKRAAAAAVTHWEVVADPEATLAAIEDGVANPRSRAAIARTALAVLKHTGLKEDAAHAGLVERWGVARERLVREADAPVHESEPVRPDAVVAWDEVASNYSRLRRDAPRSQERLLAGFFALMPPRRQADYHRLRVVRSDADADAAGAASAASADGCSGWVDLRRSPAELVVTAFKTVKAMGEHRKALPEELDAALRDSLAAHPRGWVFTPPRSRSQPFKDIVSFTNWHNRLLGRWFSGRHITVNSLRHAFATRAMRDPTLAFGDRERIARDMGHSISRNIAYAYKDDRLLAPAAAAAPRACPSSNVDCGFTFTNTFSTATWFG